MVSGHLEHASPCASFPDGIKSLVDLVEAEAVGDLLLELQLSALEETEIAGDVRGRVGVSTFAPRENFSEMKGERMDRDILIMARDTNQDGSALVGSEFVGLFDQADEAGILHKNIDSLLADDITDLITNVASRGVDAMGGTIPARHLQLMVVDVYRDDGIRGDHGRSLDDIQADASATEDSHGLADLHRGIVVDDAKGGRHGTSHEGGDLEVHAVRDLGEAVFRHDGVLVEGRHPSGVHRAAVPVVFCGLRMDAGAFAPVHADPVAGLYLSHTGADLQHHGSTLVTHEVREKLVGTLGSRDFAELGPTDAATVDLYEDLPDVEFWDVNFPDDERSIQLRKDGGAGLHLLEVDELVVAGVTEVPVEPDPLRGVEE